jgi:hypothetical protein
MADLQFDTDQTNEFGAPPTSSSGEGLADKFIKWGLVSSRQQAEYLMLGIAGLVLIIAIFVFTSGGSEPPPLLPQ